MRSWLDDDSDMFLGADRHSEMRSEYVGGLCETVERTSSAPNSLDLHRRIVFLRRCRAGRGASLRTD